MNKYIHQITLTGDTPSKKNAKQIVFVRGRPLIISSKRYTAWQKEKLLELKKIKGIIPIDYPVMIEVTFYSQTRRKFDLSNKFESIADLLVDAGYLADDNFEILKEVVIKYGGHDKENPRAEIKITKLDELQTTKI